MMEKQNEMQKLFAQLLNNKRFDSSKITNKFIKIILDSDKDQNFILQCNKMLEDFPRMKQKQLCSLNL